MKAEFIWIAIFDNFVDTFKKIFSYLQYFINFNNLYFSYANYLNVLRIKILKNLLILKV